jgi:hypothetical protein
MVRRPADYNRAVRQNCAQSNPGYGNPCAREAETAERDGRRLGIYARREVADRGSA